MTTISQAAEVGAVTCVSELTDLSQNDHWTDSSRPVCGDKVFMESSRMVVSQRCFTAVRRYLVYYSVFYFRMIDLHFRFNLPL